MTTTKENLTKLMTTTYPVGKEDTQYLNEVISPLDQIKIKRKPGRPKLFTVEELLIRKRASDKRRYDLDPQKKIEENRQWRQRLKSQ